MTDRSKLLALAEAVGCKVMPFADHYAVSEVGEVYSSRRGNWAKLKPVKSGKGYARLSLLYEGKSKDFRLNRVVAEAFYGPPPCPNSMARHLNDDKSNNRADNIAWGSASDNMKDAVRNGICSGPSNSKASGHKRSGDFCARSKLRSSMVPIIRERLRQGEPGTQIAKDYGVSKCAISLIKRGRTWKTC